MKTDDLLHQQLYRETFLKRQRHNQDTLTVRRDLEQARRFVMSDDMFEFLTNQVIDAFAPVYNDHLAKRRYRRASELYDSVRHFSRLPHRVTWVEMSMAPYVHVLEERGRPPDEGSEIARGSREGWLLKQHPSIETAFRARQFSNVDGTVAYRPLELTWSSEEDPVPWASPDMGIFREVGRQADVSEAITRIAGYRRPSIGVIWTTPETMPKRVEDATGFWNTHISSTAMLARLVWLFLSTVNKIPIVGEQEVSNSKGFFAQGRVRSFLSHKVLTLNVPKRASLRKLALRVLVSLRRAHMVRGHWRDDWRLAPGNKAIWVGEHQRGDASKGLVIHDYKVQHDAV